MAVTNKQQVINDISMVRGRQISSSSAFQLLAAQSTMSGNKRYTESQIRDMVGAPSLKENELCICGDRIDYCVHSYDHMTQGV